MVSSRPTRRSATGSGWSTGTARREASRTAAGTGQAALPCRCPACGPRHDQKVHVQDEDAGVHADDDGLARGDPGVRRRGKTHQPQEASLYQQSSEQTSSTSPKRRVPRNVCLLLLAVRRGERGDSWRGIGNCALWKGFGETSLEWRSRISSKSVKSRMRRYSVWYMRLPSTWRMGYDRPVRQPSPPAAADSCAGASAPFPSPAPSSPRLSAPSPLASPIPRVSL